MVEIQESHMVLGGKRIVTYFACAVVSLVGLTALAKVSVGLDWFLAFATVGTAIGTLSLALYTYRLAQSTRESVEGANRLTDLAHSQLAEIASQRQLLLDQAEKAGIQAAATQRLADAARASAIEAARARIDAIAPLVNMRVSLGKFLVSDLMHTHELPVVPTDTWYEAQLRDHIFEVTLDFHFRNVGASPAQLAFGDISSSLELVSRKGMYSVTLDPKESYHDILVVRFVGTEAREGRLLGIPVTYGGLLSGEMHDQVQWNGRVTPLKFTDGVAAPNEPHRVVSSAGAQVVRSYPNLDHPELMAEGRARLLDPYGRLSAAESHS